MGVFILQGFAASMPALADRDDAERNIRQARRNARQAAEDRAEARHHAKCGNSLRAKLNRMSARHHEKKAIENRREAREELFDD